MILITGATGNVGRPLVARLLARGAKVRAISRHPNTTGLPDGAECEEILGRPATDFATWAADHAESFRGMAA